MFRIFISSVFLSFAIILSGCEPSLGSVLERVRWSSNDQSTQIEAIRYAEGTIGNPAKGEHVRLYCSSHLLRSMGADAASLENGKVIGWGYYVSKLGAIPKHRIVVQSNDVIYGTFPNDFFITYDGCKSILRLRITEMLELNKKLIEIQVGGLTFTDPPKVSIFKSVVVCSDDSIVLAVDETYIENGELLWVVSMDKAKTWNVLSDAPSCPPVH